MNKCLGVCRMELVPTRQFTHKINYIQCECMLIGLISRGKGCLMGAMWDLPPFHTSRVCSQLQHWDQPRLLSLPVLDGLPLTALMPCTKLLVAQWCPTLCDPMDCSLPGCSVHGILQARTLEQVVFSFSGDLPHPGIEPRSPALQVGSLPSEPAGKPQNVSEQIQRKLVSVAATGVGNQGLGNQVGNSPFLSTLCTDGIFHNVLKKKIRKKT